MNRNVIINALASRGPLVLRDLLGSLNRTFIAAPSRAESAWVKGRLDPAHPGTVRVLELYEAAMARIGPAKNLVPTDRDLLEAGTIAGRVARLLAGGGRQIATAFDRVERISDALVAVLARRARATLVTEDLDFDVIAQDMPGLQVLFFRRTPVA